MIFICRDLGGKFYKRVKMRTGLWFCWKKTMKNSDTISPMLSLKKKKKKKKNSNKLTSSLSKRILPENRNSTKLWDSRKEDCKELQIEWGTRDYYKDLQRSIIILQTFFSSPRFLPRARTVGFPTPCSLPCLSLCNKKISNFYSFPYTYGPFECGTGQEVRNSLLVVFSITTGGDSFEGKGKRS